jgi:hypothetical protein
MTEWLPVFMDSITLSWVREISEQVLSNISLRMAALKQRTLCMSLNQTDMPKPDKTISPVTGWFVWPFGTVSEKLMRQAIAAKLATDISNAEDALY